MCKPSARFEGPIGALIFQRDDQSIFQRDDHTKSQLRAARARMHASTIMVLRLVVVVVVVVVVTVRRSTSVLTACEQHTSRMPE